MPCNPNSKCQSCNGTSLDQCTSCIANGHLDNNTKVCSYCSPFCRSCYGEGNCTLCDSGYQLVNGTCSKITMNCSKYCAVCKTNGECGVCYPGFVDAGNGVCTPAIAGCYAHYPLLPVLCSSCIAGSVLNTATSQCQSCPLHCAYCTTAGVCTVCFPGYYITGHDVYDMACAPNCEFPCLTCSHTDPTKCTSCAAGYKET